VNRASWANHQKQLASIRTIVFMDEQGVPADLEWDGLDADAQHVLATTADGTAIGCARMLTTADDPGHIGRMAVLANFRGQGVGSSLLIALMDWARSMGLESTHLDAQVDAIGFYEQHGFCAHGAVFMDAGIPHRHMSRTLDRPN
jgi:predicted GNAT family N-acyltransferase